MKNAEIEDYKLKAEAVLVSDSDVIKKNLAKIVLALIKTLAGHKQDLITELKRRREEHTNWTVHKELDDLIEYLDETT